MTDCIRCNGRGHLAITGDNDTICPTCGGTGEQPKNTVVVEAPLSPEAELRLQLAAYDSLRAEMNEDWPAEKQPELQGLWHNLQYKATDRYHMLLDALDTERQENARLQKQNDLFVKAIHILNGFPSCASGIVLDYDRKVAEKVALHLDIKPDAEDVAERQELDEALEREIETEELKYGSNFDETR